MFLRDVAPSVFELAHHVKSILMMYHMSHVTRKPVFGIFDQVRIKPACSATETSKRLEISVIETRDILSGQRLTKMLIRLHGCAGDLHLCCSLMAKQFFT